MRKIGLYQLQWANKFLKDFWSNLWIFKRNQNFIYFGLLDLNKSFASCIFILIIHLQDSLITHYKNKRNLDNATDLLDNYEYSNKRWIVLYYRENSTAVISFSSSNVSNKSGRYISEKNAIKILTTIDLICIFIKLSRSHFFRRINYRWPVTYEYRYTY